MGYLYGDANRWCAGIEPNEARVARIYLEIGLWSFVLVDRELHSRFAVAGSVCVPWQPCVFIWAGPFVYTKLLRFYGLVISGVCAQTADGLLINFFVGLERTWLAVGK